MTLWSLDSRIGAFAFTMAELQRPDIAMPSWIHRGVFGEAVAGIAAKPARTLLTSLGVAAGVAVFVLTVGVSESASRTIVANLADRSGTVIEIRPSPVLQSDRIPDVALDALLRLEGVTNAAAVATTDGPLEVTALEIPRAEPRKIPLMTVSSLAQSALEIEMSTGSFLGPHVYRYGLPAAVLGRGAAEQLGVGTLAAAPTITVNGRELAVVGVADEAPLSSDLLNAIVVADVLAPTFGIEGVDRIVIRTTPEARDVVAEVAPLAVLPNQPSTLQVIVPTGERELQEAISSDLNALLLATALVTVSIGAIAVGNVMLLSVIERRAEIGLRRALGARRSHITAQFLIESTVLGVIGAVLGTSAGVIGVGAVAAANDWIPSLPPLTPLLGVVGGTLVGAAAGILPAYRASAVEPITALRSG